MNFKVTNVLDTPWTEFEGNVQTAEVLSNFLNDVQNLRHSGGWTRMFERINQARRAENIPVRFMGNLVAAYMYPTYVRLEHLFLETSDNNLAFVDVPIDEFEQLIRDWKKMNDEWDNR